MARPHIVLYTDASDELGGALGAVLLVPKSDGQSAWRASFFSWSIPSRWVTLLRQRKQQIAAFELMGVLVALETFARPIVQAQRVLLLVDNSTALGWLRNGFARGDTADLQPLVSLFWDLCLRWKLDISLEWVASALNLADAPSRPRSGDRQFLRALAARRVPESIGQTEAALARAAVALNS